MPAMHPADGIRLHGECQVLVHADLAPPDAGAVGIVTLERSGPMNLLHDVASARLSGDLHECGCDTRSAGVLVQPPTSQVMRHAQDARADPFGDPRARDEMADSGGDFHEV